MPVRKSSPGSIDRNGFSPAGTAGELDFRHQLRGGVKSIGGAVMVGRVGLAKKLWNPGAALRLKAWRLDQLLTATAGGRCEFYLGQECGETGGELWDIRAGLAAAQFNL